MLKRPNCFVEKQAYRYIMHNYIHTIDQSKYDTSVIQNHFEFIIYFLFLSPCSVVYAKRRGEGYIYVVVQFPYSYQKHTTYALKFSNFPSFKGIRQILTVRVSRFMFNNET